MTKRSKALKAAFPHTIPVLTGYLFLGLAFGILLNSKGYGVGWSFFMSLFVFAGSAQYVAITLLTSVFNPVYALLITLMINARHLFYGISMLPKYKGTGVFKAYLIFGMTDETFSVLYGTEPPEGVDRNWFMFFITLLDHSYWVLGSTLGALIGSVLTFNTKGLDFVLTALFVVILLEHWKNPENHKPALVGIGCSVASLLVFGSANFIIPAMVAILLTLTLFRRHLSRSFKDDTNSP